MAASWFSLFKEIDWGKALGSSSAIAEGARALGQRVKGASQDETPTSVQAGLNSEAMAAIDIRMQPLSKRVALLDQEIRASFEVVNSMAQQHSQLVQAVDLLLARTRLLLRFCAGLGAVSVVLLVLILVRW